MMLLRDDEYLRVGYLLWKEERGEIASDERRELRTLLVRVNPNLENAPWDALVESGMLLIGALVLTGRWPPKAHA